MRRPGFLDVSILSLLVFLNYPFSYFLLALSPLPSFYLHLSSVPPFLFQIFLILNDEKKVYYYDSKLR